MLVRFIQENEEGTKYSVWLQDYGLHWKERYLGEIEKFW